MNPKKNSVRSTLWTLPFLKVKGNIIPTYDTEAQM